MRVLAACEESQEVCKAFRALGHEAYSCDIQEPSGGHPEWHIIGDVLEYIEPKNHAFVFSPYSSVHGICFDTMDGTRHFIERWDLIVAFPPCTYMSNAGAVRMRVNGKIVPDRYKKAMEAKEFFMKFYSASCLKVAIENPTPMRIVGLPEYTQAIQPFEYGHPYSKRTCLWLKGLPLLQPTDVLNEHEPYVNGGSKDRNGNYRKFQGRKERDPKVRSKTFPGIARAMAEQWGGKQNERPAGSTVHTL